jgi:hypothetical protein
MTSLFIAPSAIRSPISPVLQAIEYESTPVDACSGKYESHTGKQGNLGSRFGHIMLLGRAKAPKFTYCPLSAADPTTCTREMSVGA